MSLHTRIKTFWDSCSSRSGESSSIARRVNAWFNPETTSGIKRLQIFWVGCFCLIGLGISYGIVTFLFDKGPKYNQVESPKLTPKPLQTASHKVDLNEVWRHKVEVAYKNLSAEIGAIHKLFQEHIKDRQSLGSDDRQDFEARLLRIEDRLESLGNSSQGQSQGMGVSQNIGAFNGGSLNGPSFNGSPLNGSGEAQEEKLIQKFSLGLSENSKQNQRFKTVETTIPAGAFAKTVLLSGLDASSAMNASSDPRPMLLRLIDPGTLPRRFQSDLKDCHCLASAYGDLSSERIYARLEKLTCIERATGEIIETQVAGYIAGPDGKAGIRGIVASKDGQFLGRSLVGGVFSGLSNVANPQNRQGLVNPFAPGNTQISPPSIGETFASGMAGGVSTALDRLSQYYIDRAEQLQPVIQVSAGQVVDIVFTEGTSIGSQNVKTEIEKTRADARTPSSLTDQKGE
ncbi:MAG: hypothetical protein BGO67_10525 [Alphaproteobacteria bacterium 41-28]|nr:MAG: hypothetical protein BGO67_10525 [Alphaproteobacteria bacterium 41-28]